MNNTGIFFFAVLVICLITQTRSAPPVGHPKSIEVSGKESRKIDLTDENGVKEFRDEILKNFYDNPVITNFKTKGEPVDVFPGDKGYKSREFTGSVASKPSDRIRNDFQITIKKPNQPNSLRVDSLNTQRKKIEPSSESEVVQSEHIDAKESDANPKKLKESFQPASINQGTSGTSSNLPHSIRFASPDRIGQETVEIPSTVRGNSELFAKWFIETLPDRGFYEEIYEPGVSNGDQVKSIEISKLVLNKKDPLKEIYANDKTKAVVPRSIDMNYYDVNFKQQSSRSELVLDKAGSVRTWDLNFLPTSGTYKINFEPVIPADRIASGVAVGETTQLLSTKYRLYGESTTTRNPEDGFVAPERIRITSEDRISKTIDVPKNVRENSELFEKWFLDNLPARGFYEEIYEVDEKNDNRVKSIEFTKLRFNKRYIVRDASSIQLLEQKAPIGIKIKPTKGDWQNIPVPQRAKDSPENFWMWFADTLPPSASFKVIYEADEKGGSWLSDLSAKITKPFKEDDKGGYERLQQ